MKKLILLSIFMMIISFSFFVKPVHAISKLHTDGKYIKDEAENIIFLRGVWKAEWADTSTGWWTAEGVWPGSMAPGDNYDTWDENAVRAQMEVMKNDWGINYLGTYSWGDWWLENAAESISEIVPTTDIGLRDSIKETLRIAQDYDIYFQFRLYSPDQSEGRVEFPYDTGEGHTSKVWSQQDFVNFWANVSAELKNYPNIILTLFDEPVTLYQDTADPISGKSWFDTVIETVDAMRSEGFNGLIQLQWGYCGDNYWMENFYNYLNSKGRLDVLNNFTFSQHIYRYHGTFDGIGGSTDYDTMRDYMYRNNEPPYWPIIGLHYNRILNELQIPIIVSGGAFGGATDNDEYTAFKNWLLILNELEAGYAGYQWHRAELAWGLQEVTVAIQPPNRVGQALIDAIAAGGNIILEYPVNITGTVTDFNTSLPIQGATVRCNAYSDTTNSTGGYKIMMPSIGSCDLNASKIGYATNSTFLDFPSNGTYTQDFALTPIPSLSVSGRLIDKNNNPLNANINIYQEGTNNIVATNQTSNGYYSLSINPDIYDLQYTLINFFIPDFFIKLLDLDISSSLTDVINYVTNIGDQNVSFITDISDVQSIQTYSSQRPERILINGTAIPNVSSYSELTDNTWFFDSGENRLYVLANISIPTCTCIGWVNQGCGLDGCSSDERYQTRSCDPAGCDITSRCVYDVSCLETCTDGTPYGECSSNQPLYCDNGNLIDRCSVCGCPLEQTCNITSETCYTLPTGETRTFGKTDIGETQGIIYQWWTKEASKFQAPKSGNVTSISWYGHTIAGSKDFYAAIYSDNSGSPDALLGISSSTTVDTTKQWWNFTFSAQVSITANNYYWLSVVDNGVNRYYYYDSGVSNQFAYIQDVLPPDDPFGSPTYYDQNMSIYATYISS